MIEVKELLVVLAYVNAELLLLSKKYKRIINMIKPINSNEIHSAKTYLYFEEIIHILRFFETKIKQKICLLIRQNFAIIKVFK